MTNLRNENQPTTVFLRDGRVVDIHPGGIVQVYSVGLDHGYEFVLPLTTGKSGVIEVRNLEAQP